MLKVLSGCLPETACVLEIASGSGEHGLFFTQHLPGLTWQPSDIDARALESIEAWRQISGGGNLRGPIRLDVNQAGWWLSPDLGPPHAFDALVNINMIHISPWSACERLIEGAGALLGRGGLLFFYGPFAREGVMAQSNQAFDVSLKSRNHSWGVRDLEDVEGLAAAQGFMLESVTPMPANNLSVCLRKESGLEMQGEQASADST